MRPAVLGVDPGCRETGLVVRRHDDLLHHETVRDPDKGLPSADYLNKVLHRVIFLQATDWDGPEHEEVPVAIEGLVEPNPHMGVTNTVGLLGTAAVWGLVVGFYPDAVTVPPGGHGSSALRAYPTDLRPGRGDGKGKDALRHERSAWDVAAAGEIMLAQRTP